MPAAAAAAAAAAACTPASLLHPTFSAAPFFNLDNRSQASVVHEYEPIAEGPTGGAGAGTVLGGFNRNATSEAYLDGESWRGGTTSGSAVGIHSSPRVSYYFAKGVGEYHFGERHPMKPHRLTLTNHLVIGYGLHRQMDMYQPRPATKDELEMFHDQDYVDFLARVTPDNVRHFTSVLSRFNIGDDCPIFSDMYTYCQRYAGASLMAARKLVAGSTDIAINWTGGLHHAKKSEASGFCYVNDIVLAILELLRTHPRVLYIDIDIHHGDGVQEAFYNTNRVLTVSFHKYSPDFFPGTGHIDEVGHALGKNFSLNVPLQDGIDNESYVALFKSIMEPTIETYRPSAIVLQCGADSLGADRLGCFNLSIAAHGECVRFIKSFALPMIVLGGGGYTIKNVSRCWTYETAVLLGQEQDLPNALPHTPYDDFFAPDWKLHPDLAAGRNRLENCNSRESLERIRVAVLERVRYMHGAPGVQMSEVPPSLASWIADEDQLEEEEGQEGSSRDAAAAPDYFGGGSGGGGGSVSAAAPPPPSNRTATASRPRITGPISGGPPAPKKRRKASVTAAAAAAAAAVAATEPTSGGVAGEGVRDRPRPRMEPGGEEDNE